MKRNIPWSGAWACIGMLLLILDGKTALLGAREGIQLCLTTVVPALFPFIVLSQMVTDVPFLRPLGRLCRVPKGAEPLLIPAFLGGYPVGAQSVAAAYRAGALPKKDAQRMLAFCNNAGPSFLFGMAAPLFPEKWMAWALWAVHLGSAVLVARLISGEDAASSLPRRETSLPEALSNAVRVMGLICGWVVLFRVIIRFLKRWVFFLLNVETQVVVTGLLELTNGCCALPLIENVPLRFAVCSGILAAGGVCVMMQTVSVTHGLSLRFYWMGKALQTAFSLLLCGCVFYGKLFIIIMPLLYFVLKLAQKQKGVEFPPRLVYNSTITISEEPTMLFRKKIEHSCAHCLHGTALEEGQILCAKKGLRSEEEKCFRFKYDPLKRVPVKAKALDFSRYQEEDFSL